MVDNSKPSHPLVSIVILNWNGLKDTIMCLDSVHKLDYPNYEVIVVDNGSGDEQKEYLASLDNIIYVDNKTNRGFSGGHIDGYNHSNGEFILLLNNDAVISSDYIEKALPLFEDSKVAVVGGRSYFWNDDEELFSLKNRFYSYMTIDPITAETTLQTTDYGIIQEVNTVSGSAVVVRRSVIEEVGYLWELFFAYYEETDLFARIKRAGYKIMYNPQLHIWHKNGASSGSQGGSSFFYYHIFRNRYMYALRNFDNKFLAPFKRSYYKEAAKYIKKAPFSAGHRKIALSYIKSILYVISRNKLIKNSRNQLKQQGLGKPYNLKLMKEQASVSFVIDATEINTEKVSGLIKKLPSNNLLHEYIFVTRDKNLSNMNNHDVRIVLDKRLFDTHPLNIGCLVARHKWLVICPLQSLFDADYFTSRIAESHLDNKQVVDLGDESIIMTSDIYKLMGGFQSSKTSLVKNIESTLNYAYVKGDLSTDRPPNLESTTISHISSQIKVDIALSSNHHSRRSRWELFLTRHYHIQQLHNLIKWYSIPSISLRRKAGRLKNFLKFSITLSRKKIATELRYVREELYAESMRQKGSMIALESIKKSKEFAKNQLSSISNIPVFIICFERVNDLRKLVLKLEKIGLKKIVFIDNDSTYPPLLEYLNSSPYQVMYLKQNIGHTSPWETGITRTLIPHGYYIVTDPDVIPTDECLANKPIEHLISVHKKHPSYQKVGLGLKIDDLPEHYPLKKEVISWESQFWKTEIKPGIFEAGVDTTFALYKPGTFLYTLHPSLRTGEPYVARHMPWYNDPSKQTDEDKYYKFRANANVTSWNVDELPERYRKEMKISE